MQENNISSFNFEKCQKCSICTTVCPVMANNPRYAGPKQSGPDAERYRLKNGIFYEDALKYCLNCKRCEVACPSGVQVGDIIQAAKMHHNRRRLTGPRARILCNTDFVGKVLTKKADFANKVLRHDGVRFILDAGLGITHKRACPTYAGQTFEQWFRQSAPDQSIFDKQVSFFHGCFANFNDPDLGRDFVTVMNKLGYGVNLLEGEKCCGVTYLTNGMTRSARRHARHNMELFRRSVAAGRPVLTVSSTCTLTIRDEYPTLLNLENNDIRDAIYLVTKFIYEEIASGRCTPKWKRGISLKVAYHCPCHQEKLGWGIFTTEMIRMIPGVLVKRLDSNCCGLAGTYGFKSENFEVSQAIGRPLFDQIMTYAPDYVICECESCKMQIESATGYNVLNPVSLLAMALDD